MELNFLLGKTVRRNPPNYFHYLSSFCHEKLWHSQFHSWIDNAQCMHNRMPLSWKSFPSVWYDIRWWIAANYCLVVNAIGINFMSAALFCMFGLLNWVIRLLNSLQRLMPSTCEALTGFLIPSKVSRLGSHISQFRFDFYCGSWVYSEAWRPLWCLLFHGIFEEGRQRSRYICLLVSWSVNMKTIPDESFMNIEKFGVQFFDSSL